MRTPPVPIVFLVSIAVACVNAGCGTGSAVSVSPPAQSNHGSRPPTPTQIYLSQGSVYNLPVTNGSNPAETIGTIGSGMAFDPTNRLFLASTLGQVQVFTQPITAGANAAFTLATALAGATDVALDKNGDLWATDGADLFEYAPPFNSHSLSAPAIKVTESGYGVAFDSVENMYVSGASGVDVFQPPFSKKMTKAFTISAAQPHYLAFDKSGNLYATTQAGDLLVFHHHSAPRSLLS